MSSPRNVAFVATRDELRSGSTAPELLAPAPPRARAELPQTTGVDDAHTDAAIDHAPLRAASRRQTEHPTNQPGRYPRFDSGAPRRVLGARVDAPSWH